MDVGEFTERLTPLIDARLSTYELRIDVDKFPTSVEFTIISEEFEEVSRAARIKLLVEITEEAFPQDLDFRPMGLCLTPTEDEEYTEDDDQDDYWAVYQDSDDGTAAKPL